MLTALAPMSDAGETRSEIRTLFALAWPISAAQLALMLLNLVDTAVVGDLETVKVNPRPGFAGAARIIGHITEMVDVEGLVSTRLGSEVSA